MDSFTYNSHMHKNLNTKNQPTIHLPVKYNVNEIPCANFLILPFIKNFSHIDIE